jgi:hypothetical protein
LFGFRENIHNHRANSAGGQVWSLCCVVSFGFCSGLLNRLPYIRPIVDFVDIGPFNKYLKKKIQIIKNLIIFFWAKSLNPTRIMVHRIINQAG